jgi:hypothetical protein
MISGIQRLQYLGITALASSFFDREKDKDTLAGKLNINTLINLNDCCCAQARQNMRSNWVCLHFFAPLFASRQKVEKNY